jgi:hypothetical protein
MVDLPSILFFALLLVVLFGVLPTGWFLGTDRGWREVGYIILWDAALLMLLGLWLSYLNSLPSLIVSV